MLGAGGQPSLAAVLACPVQERVQGGPEVLAYLLLHREGSGVRLRYQPEQQGSKQPSARPGWQGLHSAQELSSIFRDLNLMAGI